MNSVDWNKHNKDSRFLQGNNRKLAQRDGKAVKPSMSLLADGSPIAFTGNNPLEEQRQLRKAQEARLEQLAKGETPLEYYLPFVGPALASGDAIVQGKPLKAAMEAGTALLEGAPVPFIGPMVKKGFSWVGKSARLLTKRGVQKAIVGGGERWLRRPLFKEKLL